jgi:hypothetical protein
MQHVDPAVVEERRDRYTGEPFPRSVRERDRTVGTRDVQQYRRTLE